MCRLKYLLLLVLLSSTTVTLAQRRHTKNISERLGIDAKYESSYLSDKEALLRSREFIRADSSYYLGYMLEGMYKEEHASDFFGYKNAIEPLLKAKQLLEKDYDRDLRSRSTDYTELYYISEIQTDYQKIADDLFTCYMNTEQYEEAFAMAYSVADYNLTMEYYFNAYTSLNWVVNKIRTYTSKDYSFLKNSVKENIEQAQLYLDTADLRNKRNNKDGDSYLSYLYDINRYSVYHYRAILYAYSMNIDSADRYYDLLQQRYGYSHNNRANYLMIKGLFRQAEIEYENEARLWNPLSDKRLKENIYFNSIIAIGKNRQDSAIAQIKEMLSITGSTPGFGWYNIALARAYLYDGNINQCKKTLVKAEKFKEVHIGTTLGSLHYSFATHLLKYVSTQRELAWFKKRNKNYWWKVNLWGRLIQLEWELYTLKYILLSDLDVNPERNEVLYQIFATESVISWDEFYSVIDQFDKKFFIRFFQNQIDENKRPEINNYFRLFQAKLYYKQGKKKKALNCLDAIIDSGLIDEEFEELFLARVYELYSFIAKDSGQREAAQDYTQLMYRASSQLSGYSPCTVSFYVSWDGEEDKEISKALKNARIRLEKQQLANTQFVKIKSTRSGKDKIVEISVVRDDGVIVAEGSKFVSDNPNAINYSVLNTLFGMALYRAE